MEWQPIREVRPPNNKGNIRVRVKAEILGLEMMPEWTANMGLCGMGHRESEWWPSGLHRWNGYQRSFYSPYEWRPSQDDDPEGVIWHGLDLLPCPFTGENPSVSYLGKWVIAPPEHAEWLHIQCHLVNSTGWRSAKALRDAWNQRALIAQQEADND